MNKILVEVFLPASGAVSDVFIPGSLKLYEIIPELSKMMEELSEGYFCASGKELLLNRTTGELYNLNKTLSELGIQTGTKMILI